MQHSVLNIHIWGGTHMTFLPKTFIGKWSIGLFMISFLLTIVASIISIVQEPVVNETFYNRLAVNLSMISSLVAVVGAFVFGLVSIIKSKERSLMVYIVSFLGFMTLIFLIGELIF